MINTLRSKIVNFPSLLISIELNKFKEAFRRRSFIGGLNC